MNLGMANFSSARPKRTGQNEEHGTVGEEQTATKRKSSPTV